MIAYIQQDDGLHWSVSDESPGYSTRSWIEVGEHTLGRWMRVIAEYEHVQNEIELADQKARAREREIGKKEKRP